MTDRLETMRTLVAFLCSPACMGRLPGSPGSAAARARIIEALASTGIEPAGDAGFEQVVPGCGTNIVGRLPGAGALAERAVLIAAHYDHLGPAGGGRAYWGADDNAAAVAIMLDLARELKRHAGRGADESQGRRQVLFAAFDGEEPPHFMSSTMGSMYWVRHPCLPIERIDTMICMDLVGHAMGPEHFPDPVRKSLFVLGAETSMGTPALVDGVARAADGVVPRRLGLDVVPPLSDYHAFVQAGVPVLFLTCGRWEHYHRISDTPDKLDYDKMLATADYLRALTIASSRRSDAPVAFTPDARDDRASVATLRELASALQTVVPESRGIADALELLWQAVQERPLEWREQRQLSVVVHALERSLA